MIAQNSKETLLPDYRIPLLLWGKVFWSAALRKHRSILADSRSAFSDGSPKIEFLGLDHIPPADPCLVVCNHFSRPGFQAWWIALGISAAFAGRRSPEVDSDIRWVMTSAWTFPGHPWLARLLTPLTRRIFARVAEIYGFVRMAPMPPAPQEVQQRAAAVLTTVRLAARNRKNGILIGLAPEGQDFADGFGSFPKGVGDFISLLVQAGLRVLPVGVYERKNALAISFGESFAIEIPADKSVRDGSVSNQVMAAIKKQIS